MKRLLLGFLLGVACAAVILFLMFNQPPSKQLEDEIKTSDSTEAATLNQIQQSDTLVAKKVSKDEKKQGPIVDKTGTRILTIKGCPYPIELIEGAAFIFPKELGEFGMKLTRTSESYILEDTNNAVNGNIVISNSNNSISIGGSNDGIVIVNGKVITNNVPSEKNRNRILKVTVPKGFDLNLHGSGNFTVTAHAAMENLNVHISGSADITIFDVNHVSLLDLSGASSVFIKKNKTIGKIDISGASDLTINSCDEIERIEISGSADIEIPRNTVIKTQNISGASQVTRN